MHFKKTYYNKQDPLANYLTMNEHQRPPAVSYDQMQQLFSEGFIGVGPEKEAAKKEVANPEEVLELS